MSLHPQAIPVVPEQTEKIAQAAFRHGNAYMLMRDALGEFYQDLDFVELFAVRGRPAETPWRLALVLIFQFAEGLSDEQAAQAVRSRIDWKYALSLELTDSGFDASILSEFRTRLVAGNAEEKLLDSMLERFKAAGYLKARGQQRTDSTHVLAAVREMNRLVFVGETVRHALNALAVSAPSWLKPRIEPTWVERYERSFDEYRLPKALEQRQALAEEIGADGRHLLQALFASDSPTWLREIEALRTLQRVWWQQYVAVAESEPMRWRQASDQPPSSLRLVTPYDPEARNSSKRETNWLGYKVHLTESCDEGAVHLITHVLTTPATTADFDVPALIHQQLAAHELLPAEHLLDSGYVDGALLVNSQNQHQLTVIGPVQAGYSWQAARNEGYDLASFSIDWQAKQVTCPQGHRSQKWLPAQSDTGTDVFKVSFSQRDCRPCPVRPKCTHSQGGPRVITLRPQLEHEALQQRRTYQKTAEFKERYERRAGIEGTISEAVRVSGLRRCRYIGLAKTRLQHILCAAAINFHRIVNHIADLPIAHTRTSTFAALAASP
jgi:transposase